MLLKRFYHEGLAQASYLLGCQATGEALVIDPNRQVERYIQAAAHEGLRITAVTETHIHADFVSGARDLARLSGARLYLSDEGPAAWKYGFAAADDATLLHAGDRIAVGRVRVDVLHTPGHTPEHLSFLVTDTANADQPIGIFSGDFVFAGDVGRPDLLERAAGIKGTMEQGARALFASLSAFRQLPDFVQVWPAHGAGSACGKALGAVPQSTVGYEKRFNWALRSVDQDQFVSAVLEGQPAPPRYFAQMKRINRDGPATRPAGGVRRMQPGALPGWLAQGLPVVDVRPADEYAAQHLPGTLNIPWSADFLTWAGWLVPYDRPIGLIVAHNRLLPVRKELQLIGLDTVGGYWTPQMLEEAAAHSGLNTRYERRAAAELPGIVAHHGLLLLDVRAPDEYAAGHIAGSHNIPLYELEQRIDEVPRSRPLLVYCAGGARSPIAASLLRAHGRQRLVEIRDGFDAWRAHGGPVQH